MTTTDDVEPEVVRLREDAEGWRQVDGPRLTPEDPFLMGLAEDEAERLVRSNWALRRSSADAAREFYPEPTEEDEADAEDAEEPEELPEPESIVDEVNDYDGDPVGDIPPFSPGERTVAEIREVLDEYDYPEEALSALADAERDGKNRETALDAIESELEG